MNEVQQALEELAMQVKWRDDNDEAYWPMLWDAVVRSCREKGTHPATCLCRGTGFITHRVQEFWWRVGEPKCRTEVRSLVGLTGVHPQPDQHACLALINALKEALIP